MTNRLGKNWKLQASVTGAAVFSLLASGCGGKVEVNGGTPAATNSANIVGQAATSSGSARLGLSESGYRQELEELRANAQVALNCSVSVYDLAGSTVLATGSSDSTGKFTITGGSLVAGSSYKVVTTCGTKKFTAIIGADSKDPTAKTPAAVNAKTTLIAVEIVKAVISAVTKGTTGLPASVADAITKSILTPDNLSKMVSAVSAAIQTAIDSGAMTPPSDTASTNMTSSVAVSTPTNDQSAAAETSFTSDAEALVPPVIPASVTNSVASAASAASAFPACDPSLASAGVASEQKCTGAVAKLMANVLHFGVALLKSNGAFGTITNCATDTSLKAAFPSAKIVEASSVGGPAAFCFVSNAQNSVDRNQSYSSNNGGGGGGDNTVFAESGTGIAQGTLSALGKALYNGYKYRLANLDKIVFSGDAVKGGFDARILYRKDSYTWPDFSQGGGGNSNYSSSTYKLLKVVGGVTTLDTVAWATCNASPCNPGDSATFNFSGTAWSTAQANSSLASAIGASSIAESFFLKNYGGSIPTEQDMTSQFQTATAHSDYNRTGQKSFYVLFSKQPNWQNPNCQYNSTATSYTDPISGVTSTDCTANDGTVAQAVSVNVLMTTPDQTTGISQIKQILKPTTGTGQYFIIPVFNGSFAGLLQFINAKTGRMLTDDLLKPRYVQVIMSASQCGQNGFPAAGANCGVGKMFNANVAWSNCGNNGCTMTASVDSAQSGVIINTLSAPSGSTAYNMTVQYQTKQLFTSNGPGPVAVGTGGNSNSWKELRVSADSTTGVVTAAGLSTDNSPLQYKVYQQWNCTQNSGNTPGNCTANGFYLADASTGTPFAASSPSGTGISSYGTHGQGTPCKFVQGQSPVCPDGVTKYADGSVDLTAANAYFQNLSVTFPDGAAGAGGTFQAMAQMAQVFSGSAPNPTFDCSLDPFYLDANSNGKLDFTVDTAGKVTCSEATFSSVNDVSNYKYGNVGMNLAAHSNANIQVNYGNAFQYGDPQSIISLLHTAFGSWLDGTHTLSATTDLNSLQAFALVYMTLSGDSKSKYIDGILPNDSNGNRQNQFAIVAPLFSGNNGPAPDVMNAVIGNAFLNYKQ